MKKSPFVFLCIFFFVALPSMAGQNTGDSDTEKSNPPPNFSPALPKAFPGLIHPGLTESAEIRFQHPSGQPFHPAGPSNEENQKKSASNAHAGSRPVSSFFFKFGWMFSERHEYDSWWTGGLGFDIVLLRIFSIGMETLPAYRSYTEFHTTHKRFSLFGFGNLKFKLNLGGLAENLRMTNLTGGGGAGIRFLNTLSKSEHEDTSDQSSKFNFAYHYILGIEFNLKVLSLSIEYQPVSTVYKGTFRKYYGDWSHYFLVGIRI